MLKVALVWILGKIEKDMDSLKSMLGRVFFESKRSNRGHRKHFCMTCKKAYSSDEYVSHSGHDSLEVHRHLENDVLRTTDIKHLKVQDIQKFTATDKVVVFLRPPPGSRRTGKSRCRACSKLLREEAYNFCCLQCKVRIVGEKILQCAKKQRTVLKISKSLKRANPPLVAWGAHEKRSERPARRCAPVWRGVAAAAEGPAAAAASDPSTPPSLVSEACNSGEDMSHRSYQKRKRDEPTSQAPYPPSPSFRRRLQPTEMAGPSKRKLGFSPAEACRPKKARTAAAQSAAAAPPAALADDFMPPAPRREAGSPMVGLPGLGTPSPWQNLLAVIDSEYLKLGLSTAVAAV